MIVCNVSILGISEVYEVHLLEGSFYLLAAVHDRGQLGVASGSRDGELYFLDWGGEAPRRMGKSFRAAVEACFSEAE
jgi:hypothetical protein